MAQLSAVPIGVDERQQNETWRSPECSLRLQGNQSSSGEDVEEAGLVPAGPVAPDFDPDPDGPFLAERVEDGAAQDG